MTRSLAVTNADVAGVFRGMADVLEIQGANPFRVRAYRNAARTIEELGESIEDIVAGDGKRLAALPGIGADLAGKIEEIVHTGTLSSMREAERTAPAGAVELMRVPGLGPRRARVLCERLGVRSLRGLARAAKTHRIRDLKGFGARTESRILEELAGKTEESTRVLRSAAAESAEALRDHLRSLDGVTQVEIAGSYRRCRETVGDIDLLVTCASGIPVVDAFVTYPSVRQVLARGRTKASVRLRSGLQVDLRVLDGDSFGAGLYYFTGSKAHNIAVRGIARRQGLKINEYGVFRGKRRIAGRTEREVFASVGLPWIPPELREDRGEIDAALKHALPHLVELGDVRGDLQAHTTDSDGRSSLEEMAEAAEAMGYEYLAITDHTPSVRIAGGLDREGFRRQMRRIDRLNAKLRTLTLLKGAEVDIRADGTLDLDDETIAALDVVVVSLHSKLALPPAQQTKRVLRALAHPAVDIFGHPTGRLIGTRHGARFDTDAVLRAAVEHGVMLEINAQPERLDLDDVLSRAAVRAGAILSLGSDAHSVAELRFMRWGVDQARRGWVRKRDVANTRPLAEVMKLLHGRR